MFIQISSSPIFPMLCFEHVKRILGQSEQWITIFFIYFLRCCDVMPTVRIVEVVFQVHQSRNIVLSRQWWGLSAPTGYLN